MTRWNRRLLLGAVALLVPVLAGCEAGLNAPTLEFHPASIGTTVVQNDVRLTNVFVLGSALGTSIPAGGRAGAFLAIVAQNGDRLVSVSAPGAATSVRLIGGPVNLPAGTQVTLTGPRPRVVLTGLVNPLSGGQNITVTFNFAVAGAITIGVPVEPHAYDFATFYPPVLARPGPSPKPTSVVSPHVSPAPSGSASHSVGGATGSATPTP